MPPCRDPPRSGCPARCCRRGKKLVEWLNPRPVRKVVSFVPFDLLPLSMEADTRIALHVLWWGEGGAKLLLLWGRLFVFCGLLGDVLIAGLTLLCTCLDSIISLHSMFGGCFLISSFRPGGIGYGCRPLPLDCVGFWPFRRSCEWAERL